MTSCRWLLAFLLLTASALAHAQSIDCLVRCAGNATCQVRDGVPDAQNKPPQGIDPNPAILRGCRAAQLLGGGRLEVQLNSKQGLKRLMIAKTDATFAQQHEAAFADAICAGLSGPCAEQRDAERQVKLLGRGIDDVKAQRVGEPCALGLPCGTILLPDGDLPLRLADGAAGQVKLTQIRGGRAEWQGPVDGGSVAVPRATLMPAGVYRIERLLPGGAVSATSEFSILSARMQGDITAAVAQAAAAPGGGLFDIVEVLLRNGLSYDAQQRLR